jgi:hypothetical protein
VDASDHGAFVLESRPVQIDDALYDLAARRGLRVVVRGQAVDLLDVEHRLSFHEWDGVLALLAGVRVGLGADNLVRVHDKASVLALAHMGV